jgi:hypothetical protein
MILRIVYSIFVCLLVVVYVPECKQVPTKTSASNTSDTLNARSNLVDTVDVVTGYLKNDSNFRIYTGKKIFKLDGLNKYFNVYVVARTADPISCDTTILRRNKTGLFELEVPRGHMYRINLPDSTKIWLNAMSKCRFHGSFDTEHSFNLSGETYIKSLHSKPFIIGTKKAKIRLTEGIFNIKAYSDDDEDIISLSSGGAVLETTQSPVYLNAGNIATITSAKVSKTLNAKAFEGESKWTEGFMSFQKDDDGKKFSKAVQRWYGFYVSFAPGTVFNMTGAMPLSADLLTVIELLKVNGYKVKYELLRDNKPRLVFTKVQ